MTENTAPTVEINKKSKSSRKGKKAWRKNIDLEQVEEGLKLNELDQIKYGASGSQLPDEALFEEDTLGDDNTTPAPKVAKTTYIEQVLSAKSAVPVVQSKIHAQKKTTTAKKPVVVQPQLAKKIGKSKKSRKLASLWDEEETQDPEDKKIADIDSLHAPVIKRPNTMNKKPVLKEDPDVVHPGYSYQPIKKHHEELKDAHQKQVEGKFEEGQKWKTIADSLKAAKKEAGDMDEIEYSEDEEGDEAKDESDEATDESEEPAEKTTSADPKRLTKADRRKKNNLKIQKKLALRRLKKKQDNINFTKIKSIKKEAESTTKAIEEKIELTKKQNEEAKLAPKTKFGKYSVQPDKFEVNDEVAPTLRNIQAASNPFEQHYHKFTKKNLIERRNRVRNKRTAKVKAYTKNHAKDIAN